MATLTNTITLLGAGFITSFLIASFFAFIYWLWSYRKLKKKAKEEATEFQLKGGMENAEDKNKEQGSGSETYNGRIGEGESRRNIRGGELRTVEPRRTESSISDEQRRIQVQPTEVTTDSDRDSTRTKPDSDQDWPSFS